MPALICKTCGVQYASTGAPPRHCIICEDQRRYVGWGGQQWTTLEEMRAANYANDVREEEPGLLGIGVIPSIGIGHRALFVQTPQGNVLWDCIPYIDQATVTRIRALGGLQAICFSHPHFYGSMVEWSLVFGGAPIYIPRDDKEWITRSDGAIRLWEDKVELFPGVTLVQCGGHFEGSAVLHWSARHGR